MKMMTGGSQCFHVSLPLAALERDRAQRSKRKQERELLAAWKTSLGLWIAMTPLRQSHRHKHTHTQANTFQNLLFHFFFLQIAKAAVTRLIKIMMKNTPQLWLVHLIAQKYSGRRRTQRVGLVFSRANEISASFEQFVPKPFRFLFLIHVSWVGVRGGLLDYQSQPWRPLITCII